MSHPSDPTPRLAPSITQYVLKVHSTCNLACDHCYVYFRGDHSWRAQPTSMSDATVVAAADRIAEHARAYRLPKVCLVLHGGEPLLLGAKRLREILGVLRERLDSFTRTEFRMQSNAVLLTPALCDVLREFEVRVGISLDGDAVANDRHRRYGSGRSSHAEVLRGLTLLQRPENRSIFAGILCTVDLANDPVAVYRALAVEHPPRVDFLLPHATWDDPPWRPNGQSAPYSSWLRRIHREWLADGRPFSIRLFDSLQSVAEGGPSGTEAIGLDPVDLVVVETDGTWEQSDALKVAYHGAAATGFNVFDNPVDAVLAHPGIANRHQGRTGLCRTCQACPVVQRCGGGLFAHRYRSGTDFDNPSVYCADLKELAMAIPVGTRSTRPTPRGGELPLATPAGLDDLIDDIGTGYGRPDSLASLAQSHMSFTKAAVAVVAHRVRSATSGDPDRRREAIAGWELLAALEDEASQAVRSVLDHPYVRSWAVSRLSRPTVVDADDAYLACLAAAAAIKAGTITRIAVPVLGGGVPLPTVGWLAVTETASPTVTLSIEAGTVRAWAGNTTIVSVDDALAGVGDESDDRPWRPTRRLDLDGLSVRLEDTDPYRDCHEWPLIDRAYSVAPWRRGLDDAWQAIRAVAPQYVPTVTGALRVVAPLAPDRAGRQRSSASRDAFGAVAVALPGETSALARLVVHELQHVKLGAVLDLCDLVIPGHPGMLRVPWRDDLRSLEAGLQGTYAHLAVADLWRPGGLAASGALADERHRTYRMWTSDTIGALLSSRGLTPRGERFVLRMRATIDDWARA